MTLSLLFKLTICNEVVDYVADSEVASVTVIAVTSATETAAPGLDKEGQV